MLITTLPHTQLQYDIRLGLLRAKWRSSGPVGSCREAYTQLVGLAELLSVQLLLLELDEHPDLCVDDQQWASDYFLPALFRLPLRRIVLNSPTRRIYNQQALEALLDATLPSFPVSCDVQLFTQPLDGLRWLTGDDARLPALLAEWEHATMPAWQRV